MKPKLYIVKDLPPLPTSDKLRETVTFIRRAEYCLILFNHKCDYDKGKVSYFAALLLALIQLTNIVVIRALPELNDKWRARHSRALALLKAKAHRQSRDGKVLLEIAGIDWQRKIHAEGRGVVLGMHERTLEARYPIA